MNNNNNNDLEQFLTAHRELLDEEYAQARKMVDLIELDLLQDSRDAVQIRAMAALAMMARIDVIRTANARLAVRLEEYERDIKSRNHRKRSTPKSTTPVWSHRAHTSRVTSEPGPVQPGKHSDFASHHME
jgi:hypothetical protein